MSATEPTAWAPDERTSRAKRYFIEMLKSLMAQRGWSQSDLARHAGLGRDVVSTYMRGRSLPTSATLHKLSTALGVPADELLPSSSGGSDGGLPLQVNGVGNGLVRVRLDLVLTPTELQALLPIVERAVSDSALG